MNHKKEPPGGFGRLSWNILADGFDLLNDSLQASKKQAHPHRAGFARDMVFAEFGYRHARALDYEGFVDRTPNPAPRRWWAAS